MRFPFADSPNTMTITCVHVLERNAPILHATHDADGMWQFLCGRSHEISEARVVSLQEIYVLDRSIARLAEMPRGFYAHRTSEKAQWIIGRQ